MEQVVGGNTKTATMFTERELRLLLAMVRLGKFDLECRPDRPDLLTGLLTPLEYNRKLNAQAKTIRKKLISSIRTLNPHFKPDPFAGR